MAEFNHAVLALISIIPSTPTLRETGSTPDPPVAAVVCDPAIADGIDGGFSEAIGLSWSTKLGFAY